MSRIIAIAMWVLLSTFVASDESVTLTINAGSSTAEIQSVLSSAAPGDTVLFDAGTYDITSSVAIPCGITMTGPAVAWPGPYAVTFNGSVSGNWGFGLPACTAPTTIEYFNWNGGEPAAGGGGFLYVSPGTSNLTVQYNAIHGNQANVDNGHEYDSLIWIDGSAPGTVDVGNTIAWNIFGATNDGTSSNADCGAISALFTYQGGTYDANGGYCAAIASHSEATNLTINNNVIRYQEEGIKFYEGGSGTGQYFMENVNVNNNDLSFIHRIFIEAQATPQGTTGMTFTDNDMHDPVNPAWGSWGFSQPQDQSGTDGPAYTNDVGNVMIGNTLPYLAGGAGGGSLADCPASYDGDCIPGAFEFWGQGVNANNLMQGYWFGGIAFGYGSSPWAINNNSICGYYAATYDSYIANEENITSGFPSETGNVFGPATCTALTSAAPTISPAPSGTYSAPVTVTMANAGLTNGVGPQGNTRIFYTTNGTKPTTSSTLYKGPFSVSPGTTVQAIGMWGAQNQPTSYPAGYGFVPSAPVSAAYPAGSGTTVTLSSIAVTGASALTVGGSTSQLEATGSYSNGTTQTITPTWSSSNTNVVVVSSSGLLTAVSAGTAVVTATSGSIKGTLTITVTAAAVTVKSIAISSPSTSAIVGSTIQFSAKATYSNGTTATVTPTWTSSNTEVAYISAPGLLTALSAGSAKITATLNGVSASSTVTITAESTPCPRSTHFLAEPVNCHNR